MSTSYPETQCWGRKTCTVIDELLEALCGQLWELKTSGEPSPGDPTILWDWSLRAWPNSHSKYQRSIPSSFWLEEGKRNQLWRASLPWWRSAWESACWCRGRGLEPWSRKIPHAAEQWKPVRHNYWACALEPASHNYWSLRAIISYRYKIKEKQSIFSLWWELFGFTLLTAFISNIQQC